MLNNSSLKRSGDEHYTEPEVILALIEYFDLHNKKIFLPFCSDTSPFYTLLKAANNDVILTSDLVKGTDFFDVSENKLMMLKKSGYIIFDNPPFSIFAKIIKHLNKFEFPYYLFKDLFSVLNTWKTTKTTWILARVPYHSHKRVPTALVSNIGSDEVFKIIADRKIFWLEGNQPFETYVYAGKKDFTKNISSIGIEQICRTELATKQHFEISYSRNDWEFNTCQFGGGICKKITDEVFADEPEIIEKVELTQDNTTFVENDKIEYENLPAIYYSLSKKFIKEYYRKKIIWALFDSSTGSYKKACEKYFKDYFEIYAFGLCFEKIKNQHDFFNIDLSQHDISLMNLELFTVFKQIPLPDIILASPPCESMSICDSPFFPFHTNTPTSPKPLFSYKSKEEFIEQNLKVSPKRIRSYEKKLETWEIGKNCLTTTFEIIEYFKPKIWLIENPRTGYYWKFIDQVLKKDFIENKVDYGCYDYPFKKSECFGGNVKLDLLVETRQQQLERIAKYGGGTITKVLKTYGERSVIPEKLCIEVLKQLKNKLF